MKLLTWDEKAYQDRKLMEEWARSPEIQAAMRRVDERARQICYLHLWGII